ncbi:MULTISPECIES: hypothetical protein [Pseudomonadota]|uniref:hypothetical protein n=2 Tax=Pseudomonadota TaxID=1224 RepID=UPI003265CB09
MNKPIVLVIHGMGTHEPGKLKTDITEGLNEAANNFGLDDFDISEKVEFFQFNYSSFLDEIRQRGADHASSVADHLAQLQGYGLGETIVTKLTEFFADFDEDDMLYTHWMDVVYYGLMFWGENIRVDFSHKINDVMVEANRGNRHVHIIAHSLGSAVVHDTLAKLFRKDVDVTSDVPGLDIAKFRIQSFWTVANVSRLLNLLNDIADPNKSIVNATEDGCCENLFNVRNFFDPFTWIKQYNRDEGNYRLLEVDTVRHWNTHDVKEYMATPPVSAYFFNYVLGLELSQEQWDAGVARHAETTVKKSTDDLKVAFEDLRDLPDSEDRIKALEQMFTTAKAFMDRMKAIAEGSDSEQ